MKLTSIVLAACLLVACEKSQSVGEPRDSGGDVAPADAGGRGGSGGGTAGSGGTGGSGGRGGRTTVDGGMDAVADTSTTADGPDAGSQCVIGGASHPAGSQDPANTCQECNPGVSTSAWTPVADGTACGSGRVCASGTCGAGCYIGGAYVAPGAANGANACETCQPGASTGAWTALGDGMTCGAGRVCRAAACEAGCFIASAFVAAGAVNAANACQSCQPSTSTTAWTAA